MGSAWRASRAPAAPVGLRIGPGLLRSRRAALASHSCQAWAITPRAPSADRLCASERREQKTRRHSLKPRGQYGCSAVKSGHPAAWLPSHCPRFMPCTRCAQTNRPPVRAQTMSGISQTAGAFCSSGGRAPGLRSEGSCLAAELLRAGLEPGVLDRCAGWVGLSPAQPCPRTKVRSPARPRARHPAPCPAPRSPRPRAPLSALARRSRYSPCPPAPLAGARRPGRAGGVHARARASQAARLVPLCGVCAAGTCIFLREFTNPHTQTHTNTRPARRKMPWS